MLSRVLVFSLVGVSGVVAEDGRGEVPSVYAAAEVLALEDACTPLSLDAQYNVDDCADKVTAETCTVTCEAGYDGSALYTCGSDASFTGTLPTCTAIPCTALSLDAQYNVDACAGKVTDEICAITCAAGWTIDGAEGSQTCGADASFTGTLPTCLGVACSSGTPSGTGVTSNCDEKVTAETCLAQCDTGYKHASGSSDANFTCGVDAVFVGANLTCELDKKDSGAFPSAPLAGMLVALCLHVGSAFA